MTVKVVGGPSDRVPPPSLNAEALFLSGLFDDDWYRAHYDDAGEDAFSHFIAVGDAECRAPSAKFDPEWYIGQLEGGLGRATGPVAHYLAFGKSQGISILPPEQDGSVVAHPAPDHEGPVDWGDETPASVLAASVARPVEHSWPGLTALDVYYSGLFDADWYASLQPDGEAPDDPLAHFLTVGEPAGLSPSPAFDAVWYLAQLAGDLEGAPGALTHYLRKGKSEGRSPLPAGPFADRLAGSPVFDADWYRSRYPDAAASDLLPFTHYVLHGAVLDRDPGPYFSTHWYRRTYGGFLTAGEIPLQHYFEHGEARGFWPSPGFDPHAYEQSRPSGAGHGQLEAYIRYARAHDDWQSPVFDPAFYVKDNPDAALAHSDALKHFIAFGWQDGRYPRAPEFENPLAPGGMISFDVLIDGWNADPVHLASTLQALRAQEIGRWKAILAVDSSVVGLDVGEGVAVVGCTSQSRGQRLGALLERADAEYVFVLDAGDVLAPDALKALADALRYDRASVLYTDEKCLHPRAGEPDLVLKPGWSPELLSSYNYFGRLCALRRTEALALGGFRAEAGEAAEWDLALRFGAETCSIRRLPRVLCTRTGFTDFDRPIASSARSVDFRAVLSRYWREQGKDVSVFTRPDGALDATWPVIDAPRVSVIIPSRDRVDLLRRVIEGLQYGTDYPDLEVIVVDNLSAHIDALAYLEALEESGTARVIRHDKAFNYSAACNAGAAAASGELLLFLNNDIEIISPDWLHELVRFATRPGVGIVGAMLLYPGGELQHAGAALGVDLCGLMFRGGGRGQWSVFGSPDVPRNWLAVMGACQLVRRDVFEQVGRYDETYRIANSDVALCLRIWQAGFRIAYAPKAALVHHEGATRGRSNPPEDIVRLAFDIQQMGVTEDPFHHPELDPRISFPTVSAADAPTGQACLLAAIDAARRSAPKASRIDVANVGEIALAAGVPPERIKWRAHEVGSAVDLWSASRVTLDQLLLYPVNRKRFPDALSSGKTGEFARWLVDQGLLTSDVMIKTFDAQLWQRPLAVWRDDAEAGRTAPLGLTPGGRRDFLAWLFNAGRSGHGIRTEEVWWWGLWSAELSDQSISTTWRLTPSWQARFPDALTPRGADSLAAWLTVTYDLHEIWAEPSLWAMSTSAETRVRMAYDAEEAWQRRFPAAFDDTQSALAFLTFLDGESDATGFLTDVRGATARDRLARDLAAGGVNLIGSSDPADAVAKSLLVANVRTGRRDVGGTRSDAMPNLDMELHDITILFARPDEGLDDIYDRAGLAPRRRRTYRIGYWPSPFDIIPPFWIEAARDLDEIWTTTEHAARRLRERFGLSVCVLPPGHVTVSSQRPDTHQRFVFLADAGTAETFAQSGAIDAIRAFKIAFGPESEASLTIDASNLGNAPALLSELRCEAYGAAIEIVTATLASRDRYTHLDNCDAYLALDRTSGWNSNVLDAVERGKPVIAMAYSGHADMLSSRSAWLVDYQIEQVPAAVTSYWPGSVWAKPSIESAAEAMRCLVASPEASLAKVTQAKLDLTENASLNARGQAMAQRLEQICAGIRTGRRP